MKIGAFLTTAVVLGMSSVVYANPPTELFPEQAKVASTGPYGLSAYAGNIDLAGPTSGSPFISLKLPGGRTVLLEKTGFEARASGGALWRGTAPDHAASQALLTIHQGLMFGRITLDGDVYEIRPGAQGQHVVQQLDPSAFPACDTGFDQIPASEETTSTAAASQESTTTSAAQVIDLLSVYTANARNSSGGVAAVQGLIQSAVDTANASFIESNMNVRYRLVHTAEVSYNNAANTSDGLYWVTSDPDVAALRNNYGADMVSLIVDTPSSCGTAWVQRNPGPGFENSAFQSTDIDCAVGNLTFAHEHGHNMGMEHNIENSSVGSDPSRASYDFSFAHYVDGSYRTVMSYEAPCNNGCTRVARFSNPAIDYNGIPTGITGEKHNAETGNLTAPIIGNFRASYDGTEPAPGNQAPTAAFSVSTSDLTASFSDNSFDPDGTVTSWSWDFGDGGSSAVRNPTYTYSAGGTFSVALSILDDNGAVATVSESVTVSAPIATTPNAPSGLTKTVQQSGKGKKKIITGVSLDWTDNSSDETEFVVESCLETTSGKGRNRTTSCPWSIHTTVGAGVTSINAPTTSDYKYRVKAKNGVGSSSYSNDVTI
jgi:PKD repeat protein